VRAGRLHIVLAEFEPEAIPVHLVHVAGRMARASLRAFIDFAAERLRADPLLR
jgi:DNA-binding transcriptional LysR family regulator